MLVGGDEDGQAAEDAGAGRRSSAVEQALGLAKGEAVPFSAIEGTGTDALWARLAVLARRSRRPGRRSAINREP